MGRAKSKSKEEYPVFDFNFEKVKAYADKIKKLEEKIIYLEYVKKEKAISSDGFMELYMGLTFEQKIEKEIKFLRKRLKLQNPYMAEGYDKIVWQKNKQDFVALFDLLMNLGFLSYKKDKDKMLGNHFKWSDGEIEKDQLKHIRNNIKNRGEYYRVSDEIQKIIDVFN